MKALVLAMTPRSRWTKSYDEITHGKAGHDLEGLKARLVKAGKPMPEDVAKAFRSTVSWSTALRYQVRWIGTAEVTKFLDSAAIVVRWAGRNHPWLV